MADIHSSMARLTTLVLLALAAAVPSSAQSLRLIGDTPDMLHFELLGPDWAHAKPPPSVLPEKIVAEFNIPAEYIRQHSNFPLFRLPEETTGSISIEFFYPSMQGAASDDRVPETHISAIITSGSEEASRNGVRRLASQEGMVREPQLDQNGLCGLVDPIHPGYAGLEFYAACNEAEQTFFITCFPRFNNRRVCQEVGFLTNELHEQLFYQYSMLKDHREILDALRKLVTSFVQPSAAVP